jgi:NAD(P)-dependent dehydrogenase (short-subunit alcohol dehydrogenase family)
VEGAEASDPKVAFDFTDRAVLVTGGTRGVGRALVRAFLAAGAEVLTCGRNEPTEEIAIEVGDDGSSRVGEFVIADVREADSARSLIDTARARFGRLDVLVNNVGGSPSAPAAEVSPRLFSAIVSLNLLAPFYCAQAANAVMQQQPGGGAIVNIGSVSGLRASPGAAAYGAAKAGLVNLTKTLAVEWAPKVRVNCMSAGLLDTGAGADHYGGEEAMARVAATVPLGRMGTPVDVTPLCLFLASPLATYVTGANLVADGGGEWPAYLRAVEGRPY